ncbi:MAG: Fe-S cluster assembly protein SufD [Acidobacteriota bacterium]
MSSSTAVMETKFTEQFRESLKGAQNDALRSLREEGFRSFEAQGFPTVKNEDWKYTNIAPITNENWTFSLGAGDPSIEGRFETLFGKFNVERNGFAALNHAFADVVTVTIPRESSVEKPIEFNFAANEGTAIFPRILIIAEAGSEATIIESYAGSGKSFTNAAVQIVVQDNAKITHYRVQKESTDAFHVGTTEITLKRDGFYNSTNINLGGALSRHDIDVKFTATGGETFVDGLYMLGGSQHHDTHSVIDHTVPNCTSHQSYKGVLNDKSRGVFNGKVFVRENASGTDAKQSNKNLLLSNDARVDTKPQLEIFNDDVKCAHGATVGQLAEEELFYLLTRGLPENLARNLLTYGFAEEIINKIGIESIKKELDATVLNRLNAKI